MKLFRFKGRKIKSKFNKAEWKNIKLSKSKTKLSTLIKTNKKLRKAVEIIFNKKTFLAAAGSTAISAGIYYIWDYIETNSGCFKKNFDGSMCKIKELSCCQKKDVVGIPNCNGLILPSEPCKNYKEDNASCCDRCQCGSEITCGLGEEVECQRPTVAEALSYFSQEVSSSVWSGITTFFPWAPKVMYGILIILTIWILSYIIPVLYKIFPRKRNQDV